MVPGDIGESRGAQVFDASSAGYAVDGFEMVLVAHFDFEARRNLRHVE